MARAGSAIILACAVLLGGGGAAIAVPSSELALRGVFLQGTDLALDAEGHRHIAATGAPNDLWYATDRSGAWIARRVLRGVQGSYAWSQPSITVDEAGRVHIAAVKVALWDTGYHGRDLVRDRQGTQAR